MKLFKRKPTKERLEIKRLRKVLSEIADSRPDEFMDIEREPELVNWICDICHKARIEMFNTK